jgi:Dimethyladenosine transferase (rRNA methylation)
LIKAKKSLGQNFLIDNQILKQIVDCVEIENKTILEIGPGTGNLTKFILNKNPKEFTVIEKDNNLIKNLKDQFKEENKYY